MKEGTILPTTVEQKGRCGIQGSLLHPKANRGLQTLENTSTETGNRNNEAIFINNDHELVRKTKALVQIPGCDVVQVT